MTNDSELFPPRQKWEAQGYRPDEYSRWLKGDWCPIEELWLNLASNGFQPAKPAAPNLRMTAFPSHAPTFLPV